MSADMITVAVNDEFTISLKSIATAGYLWKIESLPAAIELVRTENEKPAGDARPGDSTGQVFQFRTLKRGEYQVTFTLARPWENKGIESKTVTVQVIT
jgi:predicted secreted protein